MSETNKTSFLPYERMILAPKEPVIPDYKLGIDVKVKETNEIGFIAGYTSAGKYIIDFRDTKRNAKGPCIYRFDEIVPVYEEEKKEEQLPEENEIAAAEVKEAPKVQKARGRKPGFKPKKKESKKMKTIPRVQEKTEIHSNLLINDLSSIHFIPLQIQIKKLKEALIKCANALGRQDTLAQSDEAFEISVAAIKEARQVLRELEGSLW